MYEKVEVKVGVKEDGVEVAPPGFVAVEVNVKVGERVGVEVKPLIFVGVGVNAVEGETGANT